MEKYDKIQHRQQQRQKYCLMIIGVLFVGVACIYWFNNNTSDSSQSLLRIRQPQVQHDVMTTNDFEKQQQQKQRAVQENGESRAELEAQYKELDAQVRAIKKTGVIMETDPESLKVTKQLQDVTRKLIIHKYGNGPYRVKVDLKFPKTIPDYIENGPNGYIIIEMAPIQLIPVSVYTFLEVARTFVRGSFHRNAGHVLQVQVQSNAIKQHLPFQEYSKEFPHKKGTTGYCGRPSGPCWYVSIKDNTINHGPGSQQKKNPYEADANFGRVVEGFDDVVPRIHSIRQNGWLDEKNQIKIIKKTILIPDESSGWKEWKDGQNDTTGDGAVASA